MSQRAETSIGTLRFAYYDWVQMMSDHGFSDKQIWHRVKLFAPGKIKEEIKESLIKRIPSDWPDEVAKRWEEYFRGL